jgi:hypothetical protein
MVQILHIKLRYYLVLFLNLTTTIVVHVSNPGTKTLIM